MNIAAEDKIQQELVNKFSYLDGAITIVRPRRISIEVTLDKFMPVFIFIARDLKFSHLCTITGLDEGENLGFIYHLADEYGCVINLRTFAPKDNPIIKTVTGYFA